MKKPEKLTRGEELLAQALEECLDEDLSFVPPEREIARTHRFSERFAESMDRFLGKEVREKEIRRHFMPRYGYLAACMLVFCVCGGLFLGVLYPEWSRTGSTADEAQTEESTAALPEETAEDAAASAEGAVSGGVSEDYGVTTQSEAAEPEEAAAAADGGAPAAKEYCGQTVYPADQQDVPETLDGVTVKVNSPVQDEENPVLYLTIGNTGEDPVEYEDRCALEVWLDDGWYVLPVYEEKEIRTGELEAGMAVDEIVDLSSYEIDYSAQRFRLVTRVNGDKIGAEFTFSEEFSESMSR